MTAVYDTHAHLDDQNLYPEVEEVLARAREAGVTRINTVGCDWKSSLMSVRIAEKYPQQVWAVVGVHPHEIEPMDGAYLERLFELSQAEKVVAWGEIGLDYYRDSTPREAQKKWFREQIEAAKSAGLPIVIHDRDAHQDCVDILKEMHGGVNGGVFHCFSGGWEMAKECMKMGFRISFAGPLTYKNAKTPVSVAEKVPLDYLLVETDSPYLTPEPYRGKRNESARVVYTLARLAEIRHIDYDLMAEQTTQNALALFGNMS